MFDNIPRNSGYCKRSREHPPTQEFWEARGAGIDSDRQQAGSRATKKNGDGGQKLFGKKVPQGQNTSPKWLQTGPQKVPKRLSGGLCAAFSVLGRALGDPSQIFE